MSVCQWPGSQETEGEKVSEDNKENTNNINIFNTKWEKNNTF